MSYEAIPSLSRWRSIKNTLFASMFVSSTHNSLIILQSPPVLIASNWLRRALLCDELPRRTRGGNRCRVTPSFTKLSLTIRPIFETAERWRKLRPSNAIISHHPWRLACWRASWNVRLPSLKRSWRLTKKIKIRNWHLENVIAQLWDYEKQMKCWIQHTVQQLTIKWRSIPLIVTCMETYKCSTKFLLRAKKPKDSKNATRTIHSFY